MARLGRIQRALETYSTRNLRSLELKEESENINLQEEVLWRQKSNSDFFNLGDWNTKYFHAKTKSRVKHSRIEMLELVTTGVVMRRF